MRLSAAGALSPARRLQDWVHPERTRDGLIQTVVDMRRGVDVLLARPDVDPQRLGFYGGVSARLPAACWRASSTASKPTC